VRTVALVMAGGMGERMRRTLGPIPKPLVPVRGTPLLEWNLLALLGQGFRSLAVSVPAADPRVEGFVRGRGAALAAAAGAELEVLREEEPRGNAGCAGALHGRADAVLLVFADNLTALDLAALVREHVQSGAALTLATHEETVRSPFGEVRVEGGRVTAYDEKPPRRTLIGSGVAVLGAAALAAIPPRGPVGIAQIARRLLEEGWHVREHRHVAPWVDVNDAEALERAERMVDAHPTLFVPAAARPGAAAVDGARTAAPSKSVPAGV
jgi:NDP-sugar pyrophosphorylase family protein